MAPVLVTKRFNYLAVPIDSNKKIGNKPIFGRNKTYRGFIFGVLFALIMSFIQYLLYGIGFFRSISFLDYSNWFLIGFLMGFGAMLGDLIESFFKRKLGIRPGNPLTPFDQLDFVLGSLFFISFIFRPAFEIVLTVIVMSFLLHIIINHVSFYLKLRKTKW